MRVLKKNYTKLSTQLRMTALILMLTILCTSDAISSETSPDCKLTPTVVQTVPISITLDNNPLKLIYKKFYSYQPTQSKDGVKTVRISEITNFVFDNFRQTYFNFLSERVGPESQCDKLELGKIEANVNENGQAQGYFVARYFDRVCLFLRFFESKPGVEYDMYVLYVAKGITGVKNTFTPKITNGKFSVHVNSIYQPIEAPSIFGRSKATLTGLYKKPLTGFLEEQKFVSLVESSIPNTQKTGFSLTAIAFTESTEKKIQLSILSQKSVSPIEACEHKKKF